MQAVRRIWGLKQLTSASPKSRHEKNWGQASGNERKAEVRYQQHKRSQQNDSCQFSKSPDWPPVIVRWISLPVLGHNHFLLSQHCVEAAKSRDV